MNTLAVFFVEIESDRGLFMSELHTQQFEVYRSFMFSIAYRMLGSATEAEDIVQDAYVRYRTTLNEQIESHKALLTTIVTRLCLDHLQLAHVQRETYVGPWLPEPVFTEPNALFAPAQRAELHESLSIAFLTLLEELTALERAVFLLREVFDYNYTEIAQIVSREEAACRQLCSRAKKHIAEHRQRFKPSQEAHRQILNTFIQATTTGDLDCLMQLLSEDVVLLADGGGKVRSAAIRPLRGPQAVAQFILASYRLHRESSHVEVADVNNEPAMVIRTDHHIIAIIAVSVDAGRVRTIRAIGNPDKLTWVDGSRNTGGEA
jgi:RNA polymerase sigma-70 factor, ECF subfamily